MNSSASETKGRSGSPSVFEATGLTKDYDDGQVHALRGVDCKIGEGEFVAIVGPERKRKDHVATNVGRAG